MNVTDSAVRWQSELTPSRLATQIQWSAQGIVLLVILVSPWSWVWGLGKLLAAVVVCREGQQARRRFQQHIGRISLNNLDIWEWRQQQWQTCGQLGWLPFTVLLSLRSEHGERYRFWLMKDAMPLAAWRGLRMHWFYGRRRRQ